MMMTMGLQSITSFVKTKNNVQLIDIINYKENLMYFLIKGDYDDNIHTYIYNFKLVFSHRFKHPNNNNNNLRMNRTIFHSVVVVVVLSVNNW